jgi:hypothetical protein
VRLRMWVRISSTSPRARSGHCAEYDLVSDSLVFAGGFVGPLDVSNDLFIYSIMNNTWPFIQSDTPFSSRAFAACTIDQANGYFYIHGGWKDIGTGISESLWRFDLSDYSRKIWVRISYDSNVRSYGHTIKYVQSMGKLLLFFGTSLVNFTIDSDPSRAFMIDPYSNTTHWSEVWINGTMPNSRYGQAAAYNSETGELYFFGGIIAPNTVTSMSLLLSFL